MDCQHKWTKQTEQIFKDGTRHIRVDCYDCGNFVKFEPTIKSDKEMAVWVMPIGKYKGKGLNDIAATDPDYLRWASENLSGNVQRRVKEFLDRHV